MRERSPGISSKENTQGERGPGAGGEKLKKTSFHGWAKKEESKKELGVHGGRGRKRSGGTSLRDVNGAMFHRGPRLEGASFRLSEVWH